MLTLDIAYSLILAQEQANQWFRGVCPEIPKQNEHKLIPNDTGTPDYFL